MKFIIIIYTTNQLTVVEKEDIRGVRLRKFNLRKNILGVRMHFRHTASEAASREVVHASWQKHRREVWQQRPAHAADGGVDFLPDRREFWCRSLGVSK